MDIGKLTARITADTTDLHKGLSRSRTLIGQASTGIKRSVDTVKKSVFSLRSAFVVLAGGAGAGLIARSFLTAAKTSEGFRVRLNTLLGTVEEGNRLFDDMSDFAGRVPQTYEEIMGTATSLAGVMRGGVDEIKEWMPMITDLAAVTGMSLQETTGQVIRMYSAGAASADMFRERGVLAMMGFRAKVSYTAEQTQEMMFKAWNAVDSKFKGVTAALARTWTGMMSMLGDAWFQFRNEVMEAGVFDFMKAGVNLLLSEIDKTKKEGDMGSWAQKMSDTTTRAFETMIMAVYGAGDAYRGLKMTWLGLKLVWGVLVDAVLYGHELMAKASLFLAELFGDKSAIAVAEEKLATVQRYQREWANTVAATEEALAKLANEESGLSKANKLITAIRENQQKMADEAAAAAKKMADARKIMAAGEEEGGVFSEEVKTEKWYKELDKRWAAEEEFANKVKQADIDAQADFATAYNQMFQNKYDAMVDQVNREQELWINAGANRIAVAELTSQRLKEITAAETQARYSFYAQTAGMIAGTFMQIAQAGGQQSKRAFKLYQAFAITQAYMSAAAAYVKTLAEPALPWPGNVAMANIIAGMAAVQIALIAAAKPPSYDTGGISTTPGVYYAGVPEAHIPLQSGKVPVSLSGAGAQSVNIIMENPVFQDLDTQREAFTQIAEVVVRRVAPSAIVKNYHDDGPVRKMVRGRE